MLIPAGPTSYNSTTCFFSLKIRKFDFYSLKFSFVIFTVCCLKFSAQLSKPRCKEFLFIVVTLCFQFRKPNCQTSDLHFDHFPKQTIVFSSISARRAFADLHFGQPRLSSSKTSSSVCELPSRACFIFLSLRASQDFFFFSHCMISCNFCYYVY